MLGFKKAFCVALCLFLCLPTFFSFVCAYTEDDHYAQRYTEPVSLPYSQKLSFDHSSNGTAPHSPTESTTVTFHAKAQTLVGIIYENAKDEKDPARTSSVSVSVYTDTGKKICEGGEREGAGLLVMIPSYSGTYYLKAESRSALGGSYSFELDIKSVKKFNKTSVTTPYSRNFTLSTSKGTLISSLFSTKRLKDLSDTYLSVLELEHDASCIFSYKVNTPDDSPVSASLLAYGPDHYTICGSEGSDAFDAGAATELGYKGRSYLLIYSDGPFNVNADLLSHNEYKIEPITLPFTGSLDTSDAAPLYDEDKINALTAEFPHSDIKNRATKFFEINAGQSSVVSLLCDRREHMFFNAVSDEYGLSTESSFPLRQYSEYCSEIYPAKLCYSSYITDSGKMYLCYFGTDSSAYVEVFSNETHKQSVSFAEKYKPGDTIPTVAISSLYDDSYVYEKLKVDHPVPDATKISGYCMLNEAGDHFYASTQSPVIPDEHSKMRLYVVVDRVFNSGRDDEYHEYCELYVGEFVSDKGFLAPIIDDIVEYITDNPKESMLIAVFIILPTVAAAVFVTRLLIVKRKKNAAKDKTAPVKEASAEEAEK